MVLSREVTERLEHFPWICINTITLHELDIERLEDLFTGILRHGLDYDLRCLENWLDRWFLGLKKEACQEILGIARDVQAQRGERK
ncbi:MAG: hypothetical protein ACRD5H_12710 [Nitrososphaerales archaeon]